MDLDEQELKATRKHNGADKNKDEKEVLKIEDRKENKWNIITTIILEL